MLISIDVSGEMLYLVEGNAGANSVSVHKCSEARLPEGTIENGVIKNHAGLVSAITKLINTHNYRSPSAVATFTSSSVILRKISVPPGKPNEIASMVRNQMAQAFGESADYVFEYTFASAAPPKDKVCDVWVYAVEKDTVDKFYSIFKSLKLRPVALDIHSNCVEKLLFGSRVNGVSLEGRSTLFVDIERDYIEVHLFSGYERGFSRIAPVSAKEFLRVASSRGYGMHDDNMSLIERRLFALSPSGTINRMSMISYDALDVTADTLAKDSVLAEAANTYIGEISDELVKMVQFQMMRDSSMPVSCIYIYGSFSEVRGLAGSLSQALSCPVERISSVSKVNAGRSVHVGKYINALGALIRI